MVPTGGRVHLHQALVAIDQESLFRLGGHPIGRESIAQVLDRLNSAGARRIHSLNRAAEKMFGVRSEEAAGRPVSAILPNCADKLLMAASQREPGRLETTIVQGVEADQYLDLSFCAMPSEVASELVRIADEAMYVAKRERIGYRIANDASPVAIVPHFETGFSATNAICLP